MFQAKVYQERRKALMEDIRSGLILFLSNDYVGMNYAGNTYRYRQDSNFLYFLGLNKPNVHAILDADQRTTHLFGNDLSMDDVVSSGLLGFAPTDTPTAQLALKYNEKQNLVYFGMGLSVLIIAQKTSTRY